MKSSYGDGTLQLVPETSDENEWIAQCLINGIEPCGVGAVIPSTAGFAAKSDKDPVLVILIQPKNQA